MPSLRSFLDFKFIVSLFLDCESVCRPTRSEVRRYVTNVSNLLLVALIAHVFNKALSFGTVLLFSVHFNLSLHQRPNRHQITAT